MDDRRTRGADGAEIWYRVAGSGPRPVVLLHGWAGSGTGRSWNPMLDALDSSGLRVIAVDFRGHGRSARGPDRFGIDDLVGDVLAVLNAETIDQATVVGHSAGGRVALRLSARHGARVRSQLLLAPVPPVALPLDDTVLAHWLGALDSPDAWAALLSTFTKSALGPDILAAYFDDARGADRVGLADLFNICREEPFLDELPTVECPTLIAAGAHDAGFGPATLRETIQKPIAGARLVTLDCGHEIPFELPELAAALLEAFVAGT